MKLKRVLFWVVAFPALALILTTIAIDCIIRLYFGLSAMFGLATWRFECWSFDVPKGHLYNCPWKTTYKQAWKDAIK